MVWTPEEEPFDWPCLRRMEGIRFVRSFGYGNKSKHWISSADAAAWVAEEAGEGSPLLFLMMFLCVVFTIIYWQLKNDLEFTIPVRNTYFGQGKIRLGPLYYSIYRTDTPYDVLFKQVCVNLLFV